MSPRRALVTATALTAFVLIAVVAIGVRHGALGLGASATTAGVSAAPAQAVDPGSATAPAVAGSNERDGWDDDEHDDHGNIGVDRHERGRTRPDGGRTRRDDD